MNSTHQIRKCLSFSKVILLLWTSTTSVKKSILFPWMTMKIDKHSQLSLLTLLSDHFLEQKYLWVILWARLLPFSIKVDSRSRKSVVSTTNPIHVNHRHDFKEKFISEVFRILGLANQLFYKTFSNKGRTCLTRMHSGWYYDQILTFMIAQSYQRYTSVLKTNSKPSHFNLWLQASQKKVKFLKSIRKRVSKVNWWGLIISKKVCKF